MLSDVFDTVPDTILSAIVDIKSGNTPLPVDGLMTDILVANITIGEKTMTFRMLDGGTQRYRLGKTPKRSNVIIENELHEKILQILKTGHSAREISERLGVSINTVRSIRRRATGKAP